VCTGPYFLLPMQIVGTLASGMLFAQDNVGVRIVNCNLTEYLV
jgi:hypothetical protein